MRRVNTCFCLDDNVKIRLFGSAPACRTSRVLAIPPAHAEGDRHLSDSVIPCDRKRIGYQNFDRKRLGE